MMSLWFSLCLTAQLATPPPSGPDLAEQARTVEASIDEVTVYSDRARLRRRARVKLGSGVHALRFPDLPGGVEVTTVRVLSDDAKVLRVEVSPQLRERISVEQVDEALAKLESVDDKLATLNEMEAAYAWEVKLLREVTPALRSQEAAHTATPRALQIRALQGTLDFFTARRSATLAELRKLRHQREELRRERERVAKEIAALNLGGFSDRRYQVVALVQLAKGTTAELTLEYFIRGARWRPVYELQFAPKRQEVILATAGFVEQATGEPWQDVRLALSTAIPGQGVEFPELLTWTLGEKSEFLPRPRPKLAPPQAVRFPPPAPAVAGASALVTARLGLLQNRGAELAQKLAQVQSEVTYQRHTTIDFSSDEISGELAKPEGALLQARRRDKPKPSKKRELYPEAPPEPVPAPSAEGAVGFDFGGGDDAFWSDEAEMEEAPMTMSVAGPTQTVADTSSSSSSYRLTQLGFADPSGHAPPAISDPTLPAALAGGLDYIYPVATRASVPSSGEQFRVPVSSVSYPVRLMYVTTPALDKTAFLRARVKNGSQRPILAGRVNIMVGGDFVAESTLETTGPGGEVDFPIGADENVRIEHHVESKSVTEGVFGKKDVTTYETRIEIGNYKAQAIRIQVFDVLPKSRNEDIEIALIDTKPLTVAGPDASGLLTWELDIPAGKTSTIVFSYQVSRPTDWQLYQQ